MYTDRICSQSIKKVEAARAANIALDPRRMTAEEKDALLTAYHPDYRESEFRHPGDRPQHGREGSSRAGRPAGGHSSRLGHRPARPEQPRL